MKQNTIFRNTYDNIISKLNEGIEIYCNVNDRTKILFQKALTRGRYKITKLENNINCGAAWMSKKELLKHLECFSPMDFSEKPVSGKVVEVDFAARRRK